VLESQPHGTHILICWRHEKIPELLQSLGGDPNEVLPNGKWPDQEYAWVVQLRYDLKGHLSEAKRIDEGLIVGDTYSRWRSLVYRLPSTSFFNAAGSTLKEVSHPHSEQANAVRP
jgi:hypothetical protein